MVQIKFVHSTFHLHFPTLITDSYNSNLFKFLIFLLYNHAYFEYTQHYKKDDNQRTRNLYIPKTVLDELDLLKKTAII